MTYNIIALNIHFQLSNKPKLNLSLLGGDFGEVIYLLFAAKNGVFDEGSAFAALDRTLLSFRQGRLYPTYCDGIAGFFTGMEILEEMGMIEGFSSAARQCDPLVADALSYYINDNFDFLHGAIGIGIYMARHLNDSEILSHNTDLLVDSIERNALYFPHGEVSLLFKNSKGDMSPNLSLSHGLAAVILFLSRVARYSSNPLTKEKASSLAEGMVRYLISQFIDPVRYGSFTPAFPRELRADPHMSRLGWCYGDIGSVVALREYHRSFGDSNALDWAERISRHILTRRLDAEANFIFDAGLCHGASGVIQFIKTCRGEEAADALSYWERIRDGMLRVDNDKPYFGRFVRDKGGIIPCLNLLEGDAGIALSMMNENSLINKILLYEE